MLYPPPKPPERGLIFAKPSATNTGNFYIDDEVLGESGVTDLSKYAVDPTQKLAPDLFLD